MFFTFFVELNKYEFEKGRKQDPTVLGRHLSKASIYKDVCFQNICLACDTV